MRDSERGTRIVTVNRMTVNRMTVNRMIATFLRVAPVSGGACTKTTPVQQQATWATGRAFNPLHRHRVGRFFPEKGCRICPAPPGTGLEPVRSARRRQPAAADDLTASPDPRAASGRLTVHYTGPSLSGCVRDSSADTTCRKSAHAENLNRYEDSVKPLFRRGFGRQPRTSGDVGVNRLAVAVMHGGEVAQFGRLGLG